MVKRAERGLAPIEFAFQTDLVKGTINAFIAQNVDAIADLLKKSYSGRIDTVTINPKKWPVPENGQIYLSLTAQSGTDPSDLELLASMNSPWASQSGDAAREQRKFARLLAEKLARELPDFSMEYLKKRFADGVAEREAILKLSETNREAAHKILAENAGLPPERAAEQLAEVSRQQIGARLALVGMEAREKAIIDEIKKTEAKLTGKADNDETIQGLEKLLMLRVQQLDRMKALRTKNAIAEQEVQPAEAGVLSAKIELDKAKAALERTSGGERLDALNDELSRLTIDRAEAKARFAYLEEASATLEKELRNRDEAERRIDAARPKFEEANRTIRLYSDQLPIIKAAQEKIEPIRVILPPEEAPATEKPKQ